MATDNPLLLSAILESKTAIVILTLLSTDRCLDIEVEGDIKKGNWRMRSHYSVRIYVDDKKIVSKNKPASSVLKWEWNADNLMWVCAS